MYTYYKSKMYLLSFVCIHIQQILLKLYIYCGLNICSGRFLKYCLKVKCLLMECINFNKNSSEIKYATYSSVTVALGKLINLPEPSLHVSILPSRIKYN